MSGYAENLSRLRAVAAAGVALPPDLAAWTLGVVEASAPAALLRRKRDALLRQAAEQIAGTAAERASRIEAELARIGRTGAAKPAGSPLRQKLAEAAQLGRPLGHRQILRVLAKEH